MAHHTRTWTDAELAPGFVPTGADFAAIDAKTETLINGDEGGEWGPPTADLEIGGAGVVIAAASTATPKVSTGLAVQSLTFGKGTADDAFTIADGTSLASATRKRPMNDAVPLVAGAVIRSLLGSILGARVSRPGLGDLSSFICQLATYNGGRLTTATIYAAAGEDHAGAPVTMPRVRLLRMSDDGIVEPMRDPSNTNADDDGFVSFTSAAWDEADIHSVDYACDQNNAIDVGTYGYLIECIDEAGSNAWSSFGTTFTGIDASFDSITVVNGQG